VSNENDQAVYFDNLQVVHNRGRIIEEDHYYAFGLKIAGISSTKLGNDTYEGYLQNKNLYNDKELIDEADLDWYDYGFRNYDAQIGRFPQLDPLTDDYPELTNYQYASNDPIANIDLDGLEGVGAVFQGAKESVHSVTVVGYAATKAASAGLSTASAALRIGLIVANEGLRVGLDGQKSSDIEQRLHVNQVKEINRHWIPQGSNVFVNSITGQIRYSTTASESLYPEAFFAVPNLKFGWAFKLLGRGGEVAAEQGGLNLFKFGSKEAITETGWRNGDRFLNMYDQGSPKLNWKQNSAFLRRAMRDRNPIFDSYRLPNGNLIPTKGFLNAERNMLRNGDWIYNPNKGAWFPPNF